MKIKIWGARGSTPVSGERFKRFGGETSCVEAKTDGGDVVIFDAGTGLGVMGREQAKSAKDETVICLTHPHLDHIQGLPFYAPIYKGKTLLIGPRGTREAVGRLFDGVFHPVRRESLTGLEIREIEPGESFSIGSALVETAETNHPGESLAYKISSDGFSFVYGLDHEIPLDNDPNGMRLTKELIKFMEGNDIILADGHFSAQDHDKYIGWGHSHPEQWAEALKGRKVGKIIFGHFSPSYSDAEVDELLQTVRDAYPELRLYAAYDGCVIEGREIKGRKEAESCPTCNFLKKTVSLTDTYAVLDAILTEARRVSVADAGTVYLARGNELSFSAAQNDTLFPDSEANKFFYMNSRIPIDKTSIAGYVAATGASLNINDAHKLPPDSEYGFNVDFDRQSGYRTKSILAVPLKNAKGGIMGVLQLINAKSGAGGVVPFTCKAEENVANLAAMAALPLERSFLVANIILRMLQTSALRDPQETAGHVYRVGGIAAELYHRWALAHKVEPEELLSTKGVLRLAAMLHDVGKVGIPDSVLKKPGKLTDEERAVMQKHAALGASLFSDGVDRIDRMAKDIALYHHAKWDGTGYTGDESIKIPSQDDIPLWARITTIADVYDALVSRRCYKDAWDSTEALELMQKNAGTQFDPELVGYFIEIKDLVDAIIKRYQ